MPKPFLYNIYKMLKNYGNKIFNLKNGFRALCSE